MKGSIKRIGIFKGESENFIQSDKIQQGKGNPYDLYYSFLALWHLLGF